jgi:predicted AAA+ superfamily ATPase
LIEQLRRLLRARPDELYFWRTEAGAELDLLFARGRRRIGFEFKRTASPAVTPSMHRALEDLDLERMYIVCETSERFRLHERVEAVPWGELRAIARAVT